MTRQRDVTGFVQSHHARSCGGHLRHHHAIAELLTATHLHNRERSAAIQTTKKGVILEPRDLYNKYNIEKNM